MNTAVSSKTTVAQKHVLASRNFRLLWLGQAVSTFGDKFTEIAIPIFVFNLTGSAMQLGLAFLVQTLAALIFGLYAGVMADRWNRQRTMIGTDILRAILVVAILGIPLLDVTLETQLILLYGLGFLAAAVKQFFAPAKVATVPETVSENQLVSANSWDQATATLVGFFGFAVAGAIIGLLGTSIAFAVDAGTFLLSALFIALLRLPKVEEDQETPKQKESVLAGIKEGFVVVLQNPLLKGTVILSLIAPLAVGATQALLLVFARETLKTGDFGFGLLEGTFGLGIAFGAFMLSRYGQDVNRGRLMSLGVIGMGIGQLVAIALPVLLTQAGDFSSTILMVVTLPAFFLGAACNAAIFIGIRTIVQENSPRELIGRVFSVIMVASSAAIALGAAMAGLADLFGVNIMLFVWSLVLVFSGLGAFSWKTFREA